MEPSVLYSQTSAFEERNSFLYFVLGLVSLSHCFVRNLQAEQGEHSQLLCRPQGVHEPTETSVDDRFSCFTLGLVSLSCHLIRDLEAERGEPAQPRGAQGAQEPSEVSAADLRDLLL